MQKIIIVSSIFIIILINVLVGYSLINAHNEIKEKKDILTYQEKKEKYLTHYNYTLSNPNIIVNPYGNSPLTAIIIFETEKEEVITITIEGKDDNSTYKNTFNKTKIHYIPVLGLYPNYNNKIIIESETDKKEINIKTDKLPNDLKIIEKDNNSNNLYFISNDKYIYAIDNNNEVRWYIKNNIETKVNRLNNGHFLLTENNLIDKKYPKELIEVDLLGKIYKEYNINTGYYGSYTEKDNSLLILSKNVIEIEKNTGNIIKTIKLSDLYQTIDYKNNKIILKNHNKTNEIDYTTLEEKEYEINNNIKENEILLPLYNFNEYKIEKSVIFKEKKPTNVSKKNIFLLNYKNIDNNYKKYNIKLLKQNDTLIINGHFNIDDTSYIILDKFLDKKVYKLKDGSNYINKLGLNGKYSIYIKIKNDIYKTNSYVKF